MTRSRRLRTTAISCAFAAVMSVGVSPARVTLAKAPPVGGGGGSFTLPSAGGSDKTITFSVAGASVSQVEGAPEGTYEGFVTGSTVSVSGTGSFTMGEGLVTYLSMSVSLSADGNSKSFHWPEAGGSETVHGPLDWSQSFSLEIPVVKGATQTVAFSVEVRNCGDWVCGAVGGSGYLTGWVPLCDEANQFFLDDAATYDKHNIRTGFGELRDGLQSAIDKWEAEHKAKATMSKGGDAVAAGMWLFSDSGVDMSRWISSFSLSPDPSTPDGDKIISNITYQQGSGKLFDGSFTPPAGSESALAQSIALTATKENRQLGFGDVYKLALDQTGGDTMLAALLAHNTLRSLARVGTVGITGLVPDPSFFTKYLTTMRDGDNSGVWYHTFGTMYYQLELAQSTSAASKLYSAMGVAGASVLYIPSWLFTNTTEYFLGWQKPFRFQQMLEAIINGALPTSKTGWSGFANAAEQMYRQIYGGRDPDPEKFCFNVWGTQLAVAISDRLFPTTPLQIFDSTRTNPYSDLAGDTMPINPPTSGSDSGFDPTQPLPRIGGTGSPVDVMLEVDGVKLYLDQEAGVMAANGDFPYPVWPYPTDDGTYGLWWVVPPGQPDPQITYDAVGDGTLHQFLADPARGRIDVWSTPVRDGDGATWTPADESATDGSVTTSVPVTAASPAVMIAGDRTVQPETLTFEYSDDGHLLVPAEGSNMMLMILGLGLLLAAAGVGVVLIRRGRGRPVKVAPDRTLRPLPPPHL